MERMPFRKYKYILYRKNVWICLYIWMCAVLLALMSYYTCRVADDMGYASSYKEYIYQGGEFPGLGPEIDFFIYHWNNINGRFGDKLLALYLVFPSWLTSLLQLLCSYTMFRFACKLSFGPDWSRKAESVILTSLLVLLLPWYDSGFLMCMFINYQVGLAIALAWVWYFSHPPIHNMPVAIGIALLSFFAGSWHEQFSMLAFPGVCCWQLLRTERSAMSWISFIFFIVGVGFILTCRGWWHRFDSEFGPSHYILKSLPLNGGVSLTFLFAFLCLVLVCLLRREYIRSYAKGEWLLMLFTISLTMGTLYVALHVNDSLYRLWWFATAFSLVAWMVLIKQFCSLLWLKRMAIAILIVSVAVNLYASLIWQIRIKRDFDAVMAEFVVSADGFVYRDVKASYHIPFCTLRKAQRNVFVHYLIPNTVNVHRKGCYLTLLPTELGDLENLELKEIVGAPGFFLTPAGNLLQQAPNVKIPVASTLSYKDSKGKIHDKVALTFPLRACRDSTLVFIWPHTHMFEAENDIVVPLNNRPEY